jgi:AbrB family looped-hinge helix DNA binding protein
MTEKIVEKISSNGRIIIPKKWRDSLALTDNQSIELELCEDKIILSKKEHPLVSAIGLFEDDLEFTDEELAEAKKSLFKQLSEGEKETNEE